MTHQKNDCSVFFISDGTGITAEAFGNGILAQFDIKVKHIRLPFVDTLEKATQAIEKINEAQKIDGRRPIIFSTIINQEMRNLITEQCTGLLFNLFETFLEKLENEFQQKSNHQIGRFSDASKSEDYNNRMDAIHYSLEHDDGQTNRNLENAEVILIGVSRSGKTPTSLYLAMQYGIKVANYPLIPEDFERRQLPGNLLKFKGKIFGLTIAPDRLSKIRNERRPNSQYASLENCQYEIQNAEAMMRLSDIHWLSTTTKSIEEIAAIILKDVRPERLSY